MFLVGFPLRISSTMLFRRALQAQVGRDINRSRPSCFSLIHNLASTPEERATRQHMVLLPAQ